MSSFSETNNILTIQTVQIAPFRTLMTALKDIFVDTNITFTKEGIKIINMDKSQTILTHLSLQAENFESYECKKDKIVIGVTVSNLFKLISTIDTDDTLTIYIEEEDYTDGVVAFLGLKFENGDIKQQKFQKLQLIDPDLEELEMSELKYSSVLNLPSSDFQKIIRDLSIIHDTIEIRSVTTSAGSELIFKCKGRFAQAEIRRAESDGSMTYKKKQDIDKIIQGEFSLKNLGYFIKCTNLCNQIEMYLENNKPLVVKYDVASLGTIVLCLSPLKKQEIF